MEGISINIILPQNGPHPVNPERVAGGPIVNPAARPVMRSQGDPGPEAITELVAVGDPVNLRPVPAEEGLTDPDPVVVPEVHKLVEDQLVPHLRLHHEERANQCFRDRRDTGHGGLHQLRVQTAM